MSDFGILLAATGGGDSIHVKQAFKAACGIKSQMPNVPLHFFTTEPISHPAIDQVHLLPNSATIRPKMDAILQSPFDRTLYLDNDIAVLADLSDIFEQLKQFEFAVTVDRNSPVEANLSAPRGLVSTHTVFNSGVMGIRKTKQTTQLFQAWRDEYNSGAHAYDQPALMKCLADVPDLQKLILPHSWNYMCDRSLTNHQLRLPYTTWAIDPPLLLHLYTLKASPLLKTELTSTDTPFNLDRILTRSSKRRLDTHLQMRGLSTEDRVALANKHYWYLPPPAKKIVTRYRLWG